MPVSPLDLLSLAPSGLADQRMVEKDRRLAPAQHAREPNLAAGRREQVLAANDQVHLLPLIVHHHRELVGPVAVPIPEQQVAALRRGGLAHRSRERVGESLLARFEHHAHAASRLERQSARSAATRIRGLLVERIAPFRRDLLSAAVTGVDPGGAPQPLQRRRVDLVIVALAMGRGSRPGARRPCRGRDGAPATPGPPAPRARTPVATGLGRDPRCAVAPGHRALRATPQT